MTDASDWIGRVGGTWAAEWERTDRSFGDLAAALDAAILTAVPDRAATALDIGCGAGATSLALAQARPDLRVTGVDLSPALLAVARERARGIANLAFAEGDVLRTAAALAPLDLIVSRHGVMFFADPVAAFAALHAATASDAALVFSCFRESAENAWVSEIITAATGAPPAPPSEAPGPFAFAEPARVVRILGGAGWRAVDMTPVDFAWRAGEGDDPVADAVAFFTRIGPAAPLLRALSPEAREAALGRIAAACAVRRTGDAVDFPAAAWICSARA